MIPRGVVGHDLRSFERYMKTRNTRLILNYILDSCPEMRGLGMANVGDVQRRWTAFRQHRLDTGDQRRLFFVACDIQKAYDSIDLRTLKKITQRLFQTCKAKKMEFFLIYDLLTAARKQGRKGLPPGTDRFKVLSKLDYAAVTGSFASATMESLLP